MKKIKRKYKIMFIIPLAILGIIALFVLCNCAVTMHSLNEEEKSYGKPPNEVYPKFAEIAKPGKTPSILLVHGFGGSPYDFKPLTDELEKQGIAFHAILLPGHGTTPRNLKDVTEKQMMDYAMNSLDNLIREYGDVTIVGFSMGGVIALNLAEKREIEQLILFGPYIEITKKWYYLGKPENWAKRLSPILPYVKKRNYSKNPNFTNINDPEGFKRYDSYKHLPVKTVRELEKISKNAQDNISGIHCDVLWFHSKNDIAADFNSAKSFFEKIPSKNKTFVEYSRSNHIILFDYDSKDAVKRTINFLKDSSLAN